MRILFDCTYLRKQHTGVDVYFFNLVESILHIDNNQNEYTILVDSRYDKDLLLSVISRFNNCSIKSIYSPLPLQVFYSCFLMPFYLVFKKIDVYHNPYFFGPIFRVPICRAKVVITVHDLYHRTIPHKMNRWLNIVFKIFGDLAIKKADEVIVVSNQTKNDVQYYLKVTEHKLNLIYEAPNNRLNGIFNQNNLSKFNLDACDFILTVGKVVPSKGLDDLIRAYKILVTDYGLKDLYLVSAGMYTNFVSDINLLLRELHLEDANVHLLGYVDDADLCALYTNASVVVVPSFYEGFGLPVLEAMMFDKPIIVRNTSSLQEVVGNGGGVFKEYTDLAFLISELLSDKELYANYVNRGKARLLDFSWNKAATRTLAVYRRGK